MGVSTATVDRLVSEGYAVSDVGTAHEAVPRIGGDRVGRRKAPHRMSLTKLPSGRWRAQVYDPARRRNVSVSRVLGVSGTFATRAEAKRARELARARLGEDLAKPVTLAAFWQRWTSDPLFARPKESTNIHNRERTKAFVARYGTRPIDAIDDSLVAEWLAGGSRNGTVPALRAMFNDAASAKAGRVVRSNPFARLGISRGPGRRHEQPPSEEQVWKIVRYARELATPSFAAWLQVAAFTGLRPGELDALRRANVDLARSRIRVVEQFSAATRTFTLPKNGQTREAPLTNPAREALASLPIESEFCFAPIRGEHWTASARAYHWKAVKAAAGWEGSLYLATRHFAGWYMVNVLDLPSEDVAIALGHTDGGELVRRLYGHRDRDRALDRVAAAYGRTASFTQMQLGAELGLASQDADMVAR
jgi:integrase